MQTTETTYSFGYWLRRFRKARDLTQVELAALAGCSRAMLRKIEADERRPSPGLAHCLACALNLSPPDQQRFLAAARGIRVHEPLAIPAQPTAWDRPALVIPNPTTPLIGREQALHNLVSLIMQPDSRCVTVLGPGGVGKTRLVLAAIPLLRLSHNQQIWMVDCAALIDPHMLLALIAQALGLRGEQAPDVQLRHWLADQQGLLVLDNLEQLVTAAPQLAALLSALPQLRLLVTSRAPLRITAERLYELPPLVVPPDPGAGVLAESELLRYPAAALFLERYQALRPGFHPNQDERIAIAQLVRHLDGLPLAIELAAARGRFYSPQQIVGQVNQFLEFLTNGPRDLPARQRTMRGVIDWSYHLVDPDTQRTFARLAVFRGGFDVAAVAMVDPQPGALERLEVLLEHSLLRWCDANTERLTMFETIAEYARSLLEQHGEQSVMSARHAAWCSTLAQQAAQGMRGRERLVWMHRLDHEIHNIRAALDWWIHQGHDPQAGVLLVSQLRQFWHVRGYHREGQRWLADGIAQLLPSNSRSSAVAYGRLTQGTLAWFQRDYQLAYQQLTEATSMFRQLGDQSGLSEALAVMAMSAESTRQPTAYVFALATEAVQSAEAEGETWLIGLTSFWQSVIAYNAGQYQWAQAAATRSIAVFDQAGDYWNGGPYTIIGDLALAQDDRATAQHHYQHALACFRAIGDLWGCAMSLRVLAQLASQDGAFEVAHTIASESLSLWQALGDSRASARVQMLLNQIDHASIHARIGHVFLSERSSIMAKQTIRNIDWKGKRALVRVDFNVPLEDGRITDDTRIRAAVPTIQYLLDHGAVIVLMSHLGRPKNKVVDSMRLAPIADRLGDLLGRSVQRCPVTVGAEAEKAVAALKSGDVLILENTRFDAREEANDPGMAQELARLGDVYVNDAFGAAHRAHASTEGVARLLPAVSGLLMERELSALYGALEDPQRPFVTIIGGAKISDKIGVIENLLGKVDALLIGGGMANTFLLAKGYSMGDSLVEADSVETARRLIELAQAKKVTLMLPSDAVIADAFSAQARTQVVPADAVPPGWRILDIGPETRAAYAKAVTDARTVIWNGPMGVFEMEPFAAGTRAVAQALAESSGMTIIGGGDSVAAVEQMGLAGKIKHISTGGGASLELLEGQILPGVAALNDA